MAGTSGAGRDFFVSRTGEDKDVALVLAAILRDAGHSTFIQDEDFGHTSFMARMAEGFGKVDRGGAVIALLSRDYLKKEYCLKEARYPLIGDPNNTKQRLIVLRIAECAPTDFLKDIPFVDLVPLARDAAAVREAVLGAVDPLRHPKAADFAALYRRSGTQIVHPEVRPVPGFTARGDELEAIEAALWRRSGRAAITDTKAADAKSNASEAAALKGMGGVGKSVLAQQYAWDNRARYQGVWWVRAETRETLRDDLIALGSRFNDKIAEIPDRAAAAQIVLDHIAQTRWEKPWLLVYDNVESPEAIDTLTPASGAHVLVTTRWADWHGRAEEVRVDVFPPEVAVEFLLSATNRTDRLAAGRLAEALGHLPLALDHAAAYMRRTGMDFEAYGRLAGELLQKAPKGVGYATPVFATFALAIAKAAERCTAAQKLIGICVFLAPDRIPLDIFTADVLSEIDLGEAVAALTEVSLVTRDTLDDGTPGLSVHRLVQQAARRRLAELNEHGNAAALATELVADAFPSGDPGPDDFRNWPACTRLLPHAMAAFEHAPVSGNGADKTAFLLNQTGLNFVSRAAYTEAEPLYRRALAIDQASLGPDHPSVATDLNNLAGLLQDTNRAAEAEPLYRRALAIDQASLGPDHPRVATDLNNLAGLLQDTNRAAEAEPLYRRALAIMETSLGVDHPNSKTVRANLDALLAELGATDESAGASSQTRAPESPSTNSSKRGLLARLFGRGR